MEKSQIWNDAELFVTKLADSLGKPIDANTKELVIVLHCLKFTTSQSCEGHIDHGYPYPWIEIRNEDPDKNLLEELRIVQYLEEFYENRIPRKYARIVTLHYKNRFRIQTYLKEVFEKINPREEYYLFRENCSAEMLDFTNFLKKKFWDS